MKKLLCLLLSAAILFSGCAISDTPAKETKPLYSFTDSSGKTVTLSHTPKTVAVLFSSFAQIWQLAGGEVSVTVGESIERGFAEDSAVLVDSGAGKTIDLELLLSSQPDFVIGSLDIPAHADACQAAEKAGIPAALFQVDTLDDYISMLKICTDITGNKEAFATYGTAVTADAEKILATVKQSELPQKKILFIRAGSQYSSTKAKRAPENFVCTMLQELGAYNIAESAEVLLDGLSLEEIILQDPDYIFLTSMGSEAAAKEYIQDLFSQDGWKDLQAVKEGNYTFLSKELFHYKPNHRWAEAYAQLSQLLYPELNHG